MPGRERTLGTGTQDRKASPSTSVHLVRAGSLTDHSVQLPILQIKDLSPKGHLDELNLVHFASWLAQQPPTRLCLDPGSQPHQYTRCYSLMWSRVPVQKRP